MSTFMYSEPPLSAKPDGGLPAESPGRAIVLGVGALCAGWAGRMVGAVAGIAWRMRSSDSDRIRNRPLTIRVPLVGEATIYVSAEQSYTLKSNLAQGFVYDELPSPLENQFRFGLPGQAGFGVARARTQSVTFLVPKAEAARVIATICENFSHALIGRRPHEADSILLAITLYSDEAEGLLEPVAGAGDDLPEAESPPAATRQLSELLAAIRKTPE